MVTYRLGHLPLLTFLQGLGSKGKDKSHLSWDSIGVGKYAKA